MTPIFRFAAVLALVLAGASDVQARPTVPLARDFMLIDIPIKKLRSTIFIGFAPRKIGNKLGVCGVYWIEGPSTELRAFISEILTRVHFRALGLETYVNAMHFIRYDSKAEAIAKGKARCRASRMDWQDVYLEDGLEADFRRDF